MCLACWRERRMSTYIVRRLLLIIPTVVLVSVLIFSLMRILPGDVAEVILGGPEGGGTYSSQDIRDVHQRLGLDKPLPEQYLSWVSGLLTGNMGTSLVSREPVMEVLAKSVPVTAELAVLTIVLSLCIAIPVGLISAMYRNTWADYIFRSVAVAGLALPTFWTGSLVILFITLALRWMPPIGFTSFWDDPLANIQQMLLPALVQAYFYAAIVSRMTRSSALEVLRQDYVRTAYAKGLHQRLIISRHVLKNAFFPVLTITGYQFGQLLGGTVIAETLFSLPGIGRAWVGAVLTRDYPIVQTVVVLMSLSFLFVNLIVDLLYGWLDPRIRLNV